ncbi:UNVERIFIED_ORG: hypothetical protein ABIC97_003550 [Peribacillus simplex]
MILRLLERPKIVKDGRSSFEKESKNDDTQALIPMMKICGKTVENEEEIEILKEIEGLGTEATRSGNY